MFISYRRSDTEMAAGRLRGSLVSHFGDAAIFRDKDSIAAGEDWTKAIKEELTRDIVVLALIGRNWTTEKDETGGRHLDDPADWNRVELEWALQRGCRLIPILVDDTKMPKKTELPESLSALTRVNAFKLRDGDWDHDIGRLVRVVGPRRISPRVRHDLVDAALVLLIIASGAGYCSFRAD